MLSQVVRYLKVAFLLRNCTVSWFFLIFQCNNNTQLRWHFRWVSYSLILISLSLRSTFSPPLFPPTFILIISSCSSSFSFPDFFLSLPSANLSNVSFSCPLSSYFACYSVRQLVTRVKRRPYASLFRCAEFPVLIFPVHSLISVPVGYHQFWLHALRWSLPSLPCFNFPRPCWTFFAPRRSLLAMPKFFTSWLVRFAVLFSDELPLSLGFHVSTDARVFSFLNPWSFLIRYLCLLGLPICDWLAKAVLSQDSHCPHLASCQCSYFPCTFLVDPLIHSACVLRSIGPSSSFYTTPRHARSWCLLWRHLRTGPHGLLFQCHVCANKC